MTPLVLVHGFMGGSEQWHLQDELASAREVIAVDLPGFGRNTHLSPIDSISGFAKWVLKYVRHKGCDRFDLLGHSMGGMIAQEMVELEPETVRRLILYGTGPVGELPGRFETIATSKHRARAEGAADTACRISATWFRDFETAKEYPACAAIARRSGLPAILAGLNAMQKWTGAEHLHHIHTPTLIIWGDLDRTYAWPQVETLWRSIPNCNLAVVPNCAHAVHSENPALFNLIVKDFLDSD